MKIQAVEAVKDKKVSFFLPTGEINEEEFGTIENQFKNMVATSNW